VTLRGHDFASVQAQVEQASQWLKAHAPAPQLQASGPGTDKGFCPLHNMPMKQTTKDGRSWWSHRTAGTRGAGSVLVSQQYVR
jgi:hypothetical protein